MIIQSFHFFNMVQPHKPNNSKKKEKIQKNTNKRHAHMGTKNIWGIFFTVGPEPRFGPCPDASAFLCK